MFDIQEEIARPIGEVFALLTQVDRAPDWYSAVETVEYIGERGIEKGSRLHFVRKLAGERVENEVVVDEYEKDRAFAISSVSGPTPFRYRFQLEPKGRGTLLTLRGKISADGLPGLLGALGSMAEPLFRRGMTANLRSFRELLEDRQP